MEQTPPFPLFAVLLGYTLVLFKQRWNFAIAMASCGQRLLLGTQLALTLTLRPRLYSLV